MNNQATMDWTPDEPEQDTPDTMAGEHTTQAWQVGAPVEERKSEPEKTETGTDLVAIEKYDMVALFSEGGADPLLDEIEKQAESIVTDVTTEKGRKEIASMAYRIARSKTTLDNEGKRLKEEAQKTVNVVDAERKKIRDRLDALKEKVRAPLTEFEEREKQRVETHERILAQIGNETQFDHVDPTAETIAARIDDIAKAYNRDWQEFRESAKIAYEQASDRLGQMLADRKKRDEEAAELERLRKEKEERERKEREEAIRKEEQEKANQARISALETSLDRLSRLGEMSEDCTSIAITSRRSELKAVYDRDWEEFADKAKGIYESADAKLNDIHAKAVEREEKAEADRKAAEKKAEEDRLAKAKEDAAAEERLKQEQKEAQEKSDREKREANQKHKAKINNEARDDIMLALGDGYSEEVATALITAIAQGKIRNVKIEY